MTLLDDILAWSKADLKLWQQDAVRRLFIATEGELTPQDLDELYALLKAAHGLPNPSGLAPDPLDASHLPANPATTDAAILVSMHSAKDLNRLAAGQVLKFGRNGLTDVFGNNGTGKSGYGRGLKRACRARDQSETVHPDASTITLTRRIPEAKFDVEVAGVTKTVTWKLGVVPPEELSTVAVFDSHCARVYLTNEQEAAYLPFGLNVVEDLGNKVLPAVKTRLDAETDAIDVDAGAFANLRGNTQVGQIIAGLSHSTSIDRLRQLGTVTQAELDRLAELDRILAQADPAALAGTTRRQAKRLEELMNRLTSAESQVSSTAVVTLQGLAQAVAVAEEAERVAAENFRAGDALLPGTGEPVWRSLFDAAKRYSEEAAYVGHAFPRTDGASCVLCQQPLGAEGAARLVQFDTFVKAEAAKAADAARTALEEAIKALSIVVLTQQMSESVRAELESLEPGLADLVVAFENGVEARRSFMLGAVKTGNWGGLPALPADPRPKLLELVTALAQQAADLDIAADAAQWDALAKERDELRARELLSKVLQAVIYLVGRMKRKHDLGNCADDLNTRAITEKSKELAEVSVTQTLATALDDEFGRLGISHIKTKLIPRGGKGKTRYRLGLALPTAANLEEILSEGEQRAIALGAFLAELRQANHKGGIVFDDPVSSLDHWRRQKVAKRLAEEALHRQVIVFTHDTVFLAMLRDAAEEAGVDHLTQNLECQADVPGYVGEGLPWDHQPYGDRIKALMKDQKALAASWPAYPNADDMSKMRRQYSLLRSTIERVVQDVIFNKVVRRHADQIKVGDLRKVVGLTKPEHDAYTNLYSKCHKVTDAHDPSSAYHATVPTAAELGQDIKALEAAIAATQARMKTIP